jgi:hypothetical protein
MTAYQLQNNYSFQSIGIFAYAVIISGTIGSLNFSLENLQAIQLPESLHRAPNHLYQLVLSVHEIKLRELKVRC